MIKERKKNDDYGLVNRIGKFLHQVNVGMQHCAEHLMKAKGDVQCCRNVTMSRWKHLHLSFYAFMQCSEADSVHQICTFYNLVFYRGDIYFIAPGESFRFRSFFWLQHRCRSFSIANVSLFFSLSPTTSGVRKCMSIESDYGMHNQLDGAVVWGGDFMIPPEWRGVAVVAQRYTDGISLDDGACSFVERIERSR